MAKGPTVHQWRLSVFPADKGQRQQRTPSKWAKGGYASSRVVVKPRRIKVNTTRMNKCLQTKCDCSFHAHVFLLCAPSERSQVVFFSPHLKDICAIAGIPLLWSMLDGLFTRVGSQFCFMLYFIFFLFLFLPHLVCHYCFCNSDKKK